MATIQLAPQNRAGRRSWGERKWSSQAGPNYQSTSGYNQSLKGYRIPLKCVPHEWRLRLTKGSSNEQTRLLKTAIHELQEKGALKEMNRIDDQYRLTLFILKQGEKNRMDSIRLSLVKWSNGVLLYQHSGFKASKSNGSNRSNGVEWTPFD